jgi:hypothetical protein
MPVNRWFRVDRNGVLFSAHAPPCAPRQFGPWAQILRRQDVSTVNTAGFVIGLGVFGTSLAYHLAAIGQREIVLLD